MSHCLNITWGCRYVVNSKSTWDHCFSYWRNMVLIIIHNCLYFLCQSQFSAHKCLVLPNKRHCSAVCGSHRVIGFAGLPLDVYQPDQPTTTVINCRWLIMIYLTVLDLEGICCKNWQEVWNLKFIHGFPLQINPACFI